MTDFSQLHIGTPRDDGTFKYRSWSEIAIAASSPDRLYFEKVDDPIKPDEHKYKPTQAFFARITELQAMGILYVQERYMKDAAGGAFAIVAVKQLNRNWLLSLGVCSNRQLSAFQARCKSMINERRALWRANRPDKVAAANERKEAQAKLRARRPLNPSSLLTRKAALAATVQDSEPDVLEQLKRQYAAFQASLLAQIVKEAEQHSHPPSWVRAESLHRYKTFEQFQKDI
ncbi:hypothetical protein WH50_11920 [Pokkaliibacter plantistimulans]|uniref:Uncharacterized protein n=2 Tax=Pokkaliibacter plantistimulans TaxID=1635171 RepID=A0ABX5M060_9GAMM|nr:hypothetical protein WH50_11920 [Pokkaliibacter plantistimulans]